MGIILPSFDNLSCSFFRFLRIDFASADNSSSESESLSSVKYFVTRKDSRGCSLRNCFLFGFDGFYTNSWPSFRELGPGSSMSLSDIEVLKKVFLKLILNSLTFLANVFLLEINRGSIFLCLRNMPKYFTSPIFENLRYRNFFKTAVEMSEVRWI